MKKRCKGKKLNRNSSQRKALFKGLIHSLIIHEEIKTTESKAKAIRSLLDKLINKGKTNSLHVRRQILAFLQNKTSVNKLINELGPRFKKRTGGFSRILRIGRRRGDNAMMVKMELVEKGPVKDSSEMKSKNKRQEKVK